MENVNDFIIENLKKGFNQKEISEKLKLLNVKPNSLSSVEKKIKIIRELHGANTLFHLGYIIAQKS